MNTTSTTNKKILIWGFENCFGHCMSAVFEGLETKGYTCAGFVSSDRARCGRAIIPDAIHFFTWLITEPAATNRSGNPNRKVSDCFPFLNEFDVLGLRFELLDHAVDYFVIS